MARKQVSAAKKPPATAKKATKAKAAKSIKKAVVTLENVAKQTETGLGYVVLGLEILFNSCMSVCPYIVHIGSWKRANRRRKCGLDWNKC